jgi:hypothetical protein
MLYKSERAGDALFPFHILFWFSFPLLFPTTMSRMLVLALALYGVAAGPLVEERDSVQDCVASVPATADADTVNKVYLAGLTRNADMRVRSDMVLDGAAADAIVTGRSCRLSLRLVCRRVTATT